MSWSLPLGRIAGTDVRIHITFFLLLAWFGVSAAMTGGAGAAIASVSFILAVFACVLAHEFGHVLTARRFGIGTRDITLLPIGGVASLERMPEKPSQELVVALAGPAVNVVIAVLLIAVFGLSFDSSSIQTFQQWSGQGFIQQLVAVNVMLVLFNMLPAFPMDGGRVLRALMSMFMARPKATRIAATIGQIFAFGLGFLGLFGNPLLLFVALFVFLAASHEAYAVELDDAARDTSTQTATITSFARLDVQATVGQAVDSLLHTSQREFPVIDGSGQLRGVLTRDGIIRALTQGGTATPVIDVMERDIPTISSHAPLSEAIKLLNTSAKPLIGVVGRDGQVKGIVTLENVAEYMMVVQANSGWKPRASLLTPRVPGGPFR